MPDGSQPPSQTAGDAREKWESRLGQLGQVESVIVCAVDACGRLFGKTLTPHAFLNCVAGGIGVCSTNLTWGPDLVPLEGLPLSGAHNGYPNISLLPDPDRLIRAGWRDNSALCLADIRHDGDPIEISPRAILQHQAALLSELGMDVQVALELEFFLHQGARAQAIAPLFTQPSNYSIVVAGLIEDFVSELRRCLLASEIPVESTAPEAGPGQVEVTLGHGDPLLVADQVSILKTATKELATRHGLHATFMAKPFVGSPGSSGHAHVSLWQNGHTAISVESDNRLNDIGARAVSGILALASSLMIFYAPNVNSYKRFADNSFAPTRLNWGFDNRTVAVRVLRTPEAGARLELRIPGADTNPHLCLAALLASIRYGLSNEAKMSEPVTGDGYEPNGGVPIPRSLEDAIHALDHNELARDALGAAICQHYGRLAGAEAHSYGATVTDWERERYWDSA